MGRILAFDKSIWPSAGGSESLVLVGALASVVLLSFREGILETARWLLGKDSHIPRLSPLRPGRHLKVAIIGGGLTGSTVALWLRDAFGEDAALDIAVICDGPVGGRCQSIEFAAQEYEAGSSTFSGEDVYLLALLRRLLLKKWCKSSLHLPFAVFDGSHLVFSAVGTAAAGGWALAARLLTRWRLACHFGPWSLWRLRGLGETSASLDLPGLYRALRDGAAFAHPRELLSTVGHDVLRLSERSAGQWFLRDLRLPRKTVQELVEPDLRASFAGQGCSELHAVAGIAGMCAGSRSRQFSVCGGTGLIPERALQAARPRIVRGTARLVRKTAAAGPCEPCFEVGYDATVHGEAMKASGVSRASSKAAAGEAEGLLVESFHAVVVAHPLEHSVVRFEGCCGDTTGKDSSKLQPFRRCVAHFVRGSLKMQRFFKEGSEDDQAVTSSCSPASVWTTMSAASPFYAISLQFPVSTRTPEEARKILASAERGAPQVYKVLATRHLTENEIDEWFERCRGSPVQVVDWYGCPQHTAPQSFQPFVLDKAGVFYINAMEQVASTMELSLIGARNVVNLVADWVGQRRGLQGF
mmetsp:Transcript_100561/g.300071  ORF Transcript_100561/g.300071 Transcript_100561/m.300071 type:complete len:583 (-) Transcript_100561:62-1810(-)